MLRFIEEEIKKDKKFRDKLQEDYIEVANSSSLEQSVILKKIFPKYKLLEETMQIAGDTIYNLKIENNVLQSELEKTKEYNEEKIKKIVTLKKIEEEKDKGDLILDCLRETARITKQLL